MKGIVEAAVNDALGTYFEENPPVARKIIGKAIDAARARRKPRENERSHPAKKRSGWRILTRQSWPTVPKRSGVSELFIVEGDSAGGWPNRVADRKFQAILPLKGQNPQCRKRPASTRCSAAMKSAR